MTSHALARLAPTANSRELEILRLLGRLEVVPTRSIAPLCFPDVSQRHMQRQMQDLYERKLVWREMTTIDRVDPPEAGGGRRVPPPKAPYVYGLTPEGRVLLEWSEIEPTEETYATLRTRQWRDPDLSQAKLTHDLLVSSWCASMIDELRRCPLVDGIRCVVEYVSHEKQRIDALLVVRFTTQPRRQTGPGWAVPWHDGLPDREHHRTVRFALEVDRGTEPLRIIVGKGLTYRELTQTGVYDRTLGGPVLPVFVVPPGNRAPQIATEWQLAWPGGLGVVTTPAKAEHPQHGVLWGRYLTLKDNPMQVATLLGNLVPTVERWAELTRGWVPGTPAAESR